MLTFNFDFSQETWAQISLLESFEGHWQHYMHLELSKELAEAAKEHFTPMLHVRPDHQHNLEKSIRYTVTSSGSGWEIDFYGLFYGLYIDEGNFPPGEVLDAKSYNMGAFPVDQRLGNTHFAQRIRGIGAQNSNAPTHYSEKTVDWLAEDKATELALNNLMKFLDEVVMNAPSD